jgi:hypothetical protein
MSTFYSLEQQRRHPAGFPQNVATLSKPFSAASLLEIVNKVLSQRRVKIGGYGSALAIRLGPQSAPQDRTPVRRRHRFSSPDSEK